MMKFPAKVASILLTPGSQKEDCFTYSKWEKIHAVSKCLLSAE